MRHVLLFLFILSLGLSAACDPRERPAGRVDEPDAPEPDAPFVDDGSWGWHWRTGPHAVRSTVLDDGVVLTLWSLEDEPGGYVARWNAEGIQGARVLPLSRDEPRLQYLDVEAEGGDLLVLGRRFQDGRSDEVTYVEDSRLDSEPIAVRENEGVVLTLDPFNLTVTHRVVDKLAASDVVAGGNGWRFLWGAGFVAVAGANDHVVAQWRQDDRAVSTLRFDMGFEDAATFVALPVAGKSESYVVTGEVLLRNTSEVPFVDGASFRAAQSSDASVAMLGVMEAEGARWLRFFESDADVKLHVVRRPVGLTVCLAALEPVTLVDARDGATVLSLQATVPTAYAIDMTFDGDIDVAQELGSASSVHCAPDGDVLLWAILGGDDGVRFIRRVASDVRVSAALPNSAPSTTLHGFVLDDGAPVLMAALPQGASLARIQQEAISPLEERAAVLMRPNLSDLEGPRP
jgi:hypothetical protein